MSNIKNSITVPVAFVCFATIWKGTGSRKSFDNRHPRWQVRTEILIHFFPCEFLLQILSRVPPIFTRIIDVTTLPAKVNTDRESGSINFALWFWVSEVAKFMSRKIYLISKIRLFRLASFSSGWRSIRNFGLEQEEIFVVLSFNYRNRFPVYLRRIFKLKTETLVSICFPICSFVYWRWGRYPWCCRLDNWLLFPRQSKISHCTS